MYTMLKQTVILLATVYIVYAAVALQPLQWKPNKFVNVEGCYVKELDTVIPLGQSAPSKSSCMQYKCGKSKLELITCGPSAEPSCYEVEDTTKSYPDCCPIILCDV